MSIETICLPLWSGITPTDFDLIVGTGWFKSCSCMLIELGIIVGNSLTVSDSITL